MAKKDHDELAAQKRKVDYHKDRYDYGLVALKKLPLPQTFTVLDLGCGNGEFSELVRENFNQADISCLDYSQTHLRRVRKLGFKTIRCDFDNPRDIAQLTNQREKSFDVVVMFEVIEHIFDADTLLAVANTLLKRRGYLIISTPNMAYIMHRLYSMFRGNVPVDESHHVRFFDQRRLRQMLLLNGFSPLISYGFSRSLYWNQRIYGENSTVRKVIVNGIYVLSGFPYFRKYTWYNSKLLVVAQKNEAMPIGLDPTIRDRIWMNLKPNQKKTALKTLMPLRCNNFFEEHPGLIAFIDKESTDE